MIWYVMRRARHYPVSGLVVWLSRFPPHSGEPIIAHTSLNHRTSCLPRGQPTSSRPAASLTRTAYGTNSLLLIYPQINVNVFSSNFSNMPALSRPPASLTCSLYGGISLRELLSVSWPGLRPWMLFVCRLFKIKHRNYIIRDKSIFLNIIRQ